MRTAQFFATLAATLAIGSTGQAQQQSQILIAHRATLIAVGEVVYVAKPLPLLTMISHTNSQVVVYRLAKVLKGAHESQFVKVKYEFALDQPGLPSMPFSTGSKVILLLSRREDSSNCYEAALTEGFKYDVNSNPEFRKYNGVPCYMSRPVFAIAATVEEIEAIEWLLSPTPRN
jgi:hypothetical protein